MGTLQGSIGLEMVPSGLALSLRRWSRPALGVSPQFSSAGVGSGLALCQSPGEGEKGDQMA